MLLPFCIQSYPFKVMSRLKAGGEAFKVHTAQPDEEGTLVSWPLIQYFSCVVTEKFLYLNYTNYVMPSFYSLQRQRLAAGRVRVKLSMGRAACTGVWFLCKKGNMLSWNELLCQETLRGLNAITSPPSFKVWGDLVLMESWVVKSLEWTQKRFLFC